MLPETSSSRNDFFFFVNEKRHYWLIAAGWHAVWRWPWYLLRVPSVLREAGELSSTCSAEQELQEPHPCFFWIVRWFSIDEFIAEMLRSGTIQICFLWLCRRNVSAIEGRDRCDLVRSNRKLKLFHSCWEECIDFTDISRFKDIRVLWKRNRSKQFRIEELYYLVVKCVVVFYQFRKNRKIFRRVSTASKNMCFQDNVFDMFPTEKRIITSKKVFPIVVIEQCVFSIDDCIFRRDAVLNRFETRVGRKKRSVQFYWM